MTAAAWVGVYYHISTILLQREKVFKARQGVAGVAGLLETICSIGNGLRPIFQGGKGRATEEGMRTRKPRKLRPIPVQRRPDPYDHEGAMEEQMNQRHVETSSLTILRLSTFRERRFRVNGRQQG